MNARRAARFLYENEGSQFNIYYEGRKSGTIEVSGGTFSRKAFEDAKASVSWCPIKRNLIAVESDSVKETFWIPLDTCWKISILEDIGEGFSTSSRLKVKEEFCPGYPPVKLNSDHKRLVQEAKRVQDLFREELKEMFY